MKFYNTREAAEKLQISIHTLRKYLNRGWVKAGRLPGGTIWRFTDRQLEQAIAFMEGGNDAESAISTTVGSSGAVR